MPSKMTDFALFKPKEALVEAMRDCLTVCERQNRPLDLNVKKDIEALRALLHQPCKTEHALLLLLQDYCYNKIHRRYHWYTFWLIPCTNYLELFVLKTLRRFCLAVKLMQAQAREAKQRYNIETLTRANERLHQQFYLLSKQICRLEERVDRMRDENTALKDRCAAAGLLDDALSPNV